MKVNETKQKNTENKVLAYCRKHTMFQAGDKVVLGVSGGADSICLLFVLLELRAVLGISLQVVHVNHGVREDAAEDAAYVEELCCKYGIPFMLEEIQLHDLAKALGATGEEAGRIARYRAFEKACGVYGCNKVAVAHNSNDRAETVLFHLFRGTGLKGMAGIQPVRDHIVRPLLCLERGEIEAYLEARGLVYKQDSTNDTDDYTRNRIRHHIIPYAQQNIAEGCVANMCRAADIFAEEEGYLQEQTNAARQVCVMRNRSIAATRQQNGSSGAFGNHTGNGRLDFEISVELFLQQHPVIQKRLLMMLLKELSPRHQDITAVHITDILTLFTREGNRQIHLPYGIRGERSYGKVWLDRRQENTCRTETNVSLSAEVWQGKEVSLSAEVMQDGEAGQSAEVMQDGEFWSEHVALTKSDREWDEQTITLPEGSKFTFKIMENIQDPGKNYVFSQNRYTKWFDYDKMIKPLQVRTRQPGDYLTIRGKDAMQHKKLKDYMVTEKIAKGERDTIPLLAEESHVLWLVGYRISEYYKVTADTKKILQVQFIQCGKNTL